MSNPMEDIEHLQMLSDVWNAMSQIEDPDNAIALIEELIAASPPASMQPQLQAQLAALRGMRSRRTGNVQATRSMDGAFLATPAGGRDTAPVTGTTHNSRGFSLYNHMTQITATMMKFEETGNIDHLNVIITLAEEIVAVITPDRPGRRAVLGILIYHYYRRFDLLDGQEDLERAIQTAWQIIETSTLRELWESNILNVLSILFYLKCGKFGVLEECERLIPVFEEGATELFPFSRDRASSLLMLSTDLYQRLEQLGNLADLDRSIQITQLVLHTTPPGHPMRARALKNIVTGLWGRFNLSGAPEDIEKAIGASAEVVVATPADCPELHNVLINHSMLLLLRFRYLRSPEDIDTSMEMAQGASAAVPGGGSPSGEILMGVGTTFHTRFERFGALEDLEKAINFHVQAVEAIPPGGSARPMALVALASSFFSRFLRLGVASDLEKAIVVGELSVEASRPNPHLHHHLSMLPIRFRLSMSRTIEDIDRSIEDIKRLIESALVVGDSDCAARYRLLSCEFQLRFTQSQELNDLENAIQAAELAVEVLPTDHPLGAEMLYCLATLLSMYTLVTHRILHSMLKGNPVECQLSEYEHQRFRKKMDAFLQYLNIPGNSPVPIPQDYLLCQLSESGHQRFRKKMDAFLQHLDIPALGSRSSHFQDSVDHYLMAWGCDNSWPLQRINSAHKAAKYLGWMGRWAEASSLLDATVKMLPAISPQFLGPDDQQHALSEFSPLTADALAAALQVGSDINHCLTLLELGRGIIMGFGIDCRSDLPKLQENSDLFNKFNRLRIEIDTPLAKVLGESSQSTERRRRRRVHVIREMGQTLASIRQQPGFEDFQLPPRPVNLMAMAKEGAIIIINSTMHRSDAILVTDSDIKSLRLPKLVFSDVEIRMKQLAAVVRGSQATYNSRNEEMESVLLWLWESTVEPVFNELKLRALHNSELPHVWWIGVGSLSAAPFHAAGNHSRGSKRNTLSRAISSYIPTIKALAYARQKKLNLGPNCRLLLVTMPTTPDTPATPFIPASTRVPTVPDTHGITAMYRSDAIPATPAQKWTPLKNAQKEVHNIVNTVNQRSTTRFESPTVTQVLEELPYHHVIHFACHGISDPANPSNSHLLLHGDDPSKPGKLTVKAISRMNIKDAQVAYLSACCTADNPSTALANESIHITSGFQLAGFSHVLGTLWDSNDEACRKVSVEFYRTLFHQDRTVDEGHRVVSTDFHHAVKKLRSEMLGQPIKWASFVHTGAWAAIVLVSWPFFW
ncbi:hypothetical protein Q9L58_005600 [Maublancomyces gigas]|uniref:CHAT domain-containing protein n=1 Tax=Discina gigas TaxID=1032678 RepID=A0ABR3GHP8_9PEZI